MKNETKLWLGMTIMITVIALLLTYALFNKECEQTITEEDINLAYATGYQQALFNVAETSKACQPFRTGVDNTTADLISIECLK